MRISNEERALTLLILYCIVHCVTSHARLVEPPSRSSMWRFGYQVPKNYDDDGLYCGGMDVQHKQNGGKCGVCGDPWHLTPPRPNERGGKYGQGIIVRSYRTGQVIQAAVEITANHRGYFEFRVCPSRSDHKEVIQECLDKHLMNIINSGSTRYHVGTHGNSRVDLSLQLPKSLTCKRCVLQWTYVAGNNWGRCKNDTYALGCGSQETFKACSDIAIGNNVLATTANPIAATTVKPISNTTWANERPSTKKPTGTRPRPTTRWTVNRRTTTKSPKKFPPFRPPPKKATTFEEALENIRKNPKLRWMLELKNQNHLREMLSSWF